MRPFSKRKKSKWWLELIESVAVMLALTGLVIGFSSCTDKYNLQGMGNNIYGRKQGWTRNECWNNKNSLRCPWIYQK